MSQTPDSLYGPQDSQPEAAAGPGLFEQISGVFTGPAATFDRLGKAPVWGVPYLFLSTLTFIFTLIWVFRVDWLAFIADRAEKAGQPAQAIPESALGVIKAVGVVQVMAISFGLMLVLGLVLWGLGRWLSEDKQSIRFGHAMATLTAPSLVKLPVLLLGAIAVAFREVDIQTPDKFIPTSVGFHLHVDNPKVQALLQSLDPFAFAFGVLGYMALRRILKLSPGAAVALLVVYNCLFNLLPILKAK